MKKPNERGSRDDMRPEYDFASLSGGIRAKHYQKYRKGSNVVLLQPDVAEAFPSEEAVNEALRGVLKTTRAVRLFLWTFREEQIKLQPHAPR
jgi:hypothetical protein